MNALAQPATPIPQSAAVPLLRTLVLCDLVDSTALIERLGDQRAAELFRKHDRLARSLLQTHGGHEIDKTDGFLVMFDRPVQGTAFALDYLRSLRELNVAESTRLAARVGIHVGDIVSWDNAADDIAKGAKPVEVEGLVKPIASRLMQLALPNQILLSGVAYALTHRAQGELGAKLAHVRWRTHGRYRFKGIPDPIPVFEVGDEGLAPLKPPPWSGKAHREVPFWRRPATLGIELFVLFVLLAVPAWYLLKPEPAIAFANRDWVVVGDLRNLTGEAAFDDSIATAFRIGLEQSRYVNVLSDLKTRETVQLMQKDPDRTPIDRAVGSEVAIRDGARALILPTIAEIGGRVRVTAEVVDPKTQTTVWSESADGAGASSVLPSLDAVNQKLRVRLGEALATVSRESKPLDKVATKNLDALRAYSLGVSEYVKGNFKDAIALYRQAIALDQDFALARIDLGIVLSDTSGGDDREAISEFRKAAQLGDRLSPRDALYAQASLANYEAPGPAMEKWRLLAQLYPDFARATGALGWRSYVVLNDFDAAIAATEKNAVATNPHRAAGDYLLATLYLGNERFADSRSRFGEAAANGFSSHGTYNAYLFAAQRDFERAQDLLSRGKPSGIPAEDAQAWGSRIVLAADRGRWSEARMWVRRALDATTVLGGDVHADFELVELGLRTLEEPYTSVKGSVEGFLKSALAQSPSTYQQQFRVLFAAYLAARGGDPDLAQSAVQHVAATNDAAQAPYVVALRGIVQAQLQLAAGKPQAAISMLKSQLNGREYYFSHQVLMEACVAAGDHAGALSEARWMAAHRGRAFAEQFGQDLLAPFNVVQSDLALLQIAEHSLALGKKKEAGAALADFRKAWPQAGDAAFVSLRIKQIEARL